MTVSVVVLNRDRLAELECCLAALGQQSNRTFELVIVSNQVETLQSRIPSASRATLVPFSEPNVSAARNAGITVARSDIIVFCDDDSVAEPFWLDRLIRPFDDAQVGAVGGLVFGRNGVSVQWGPQEVDKCGNDWPAGPDPDPDRVRKTVGTNCAFRRAALRAVGGFDEAYKYYLEEADLNWRLKNAGWTIAFAPMAAVHHRFSPSMYRSSARVPKSLFEVGASKAHFCAKFCPPGMEADEVRGFVRAQERRVFKLMNLGLIEPRNVRGLLGSLDEGLAAGRHRVEKLCEAQQAGPGDLRPFPIGAMPEQTVMSCGALNRTKGRREAVQLTDWPPSVS